MYSSFERAINARKQLRGKDGKWIYEGGSVKWFDALTGVWKSGVVDGFKGDYVTIKDHQGTSSRVHRSGITAIPKKATLTMTPPKGGKIGFNAAAKNRWDEVDYNAQPKGTILNIQMNNGGTDTITKGDKDDWISKNTGLVVPKDTLLRFDVKGQTEVADPDEGKPTDISSWKKGKNLGGSNGAAIYTDQNGDQYAVKFLKSEDHAKNEVLASRLYDLAGVPTPGQELVTLNGKTGIASPMVPDAQGDLSSKLNDKEYLDKLREGFAADAWLANWDVAGLTYDNVMTDSNGDPIRIDPGGALLYRAQGAPKGDQFGDKANEWDSLRTSAQGQKIFGDMTPEQATNSAKALQNVTDAQIDEMVDSVDFDSATADKLKATLKARRDDVITRAGLETSDTSDSSKADLPAASGNVIEYDGTDSKIPADTPFGRYYAEKVKHGSAFFWDGANGWFKAHFSDPTNAGDKPEWLGIKNGYSPQPGDIIFRKMPNSTAKERFVVLQETDTPGEFLAQKSAGYGKKQGNGLISFTGDDKNITSVIRPTKDAPPSNKGPMKPGVIPAPKAPVVKKTPYAEQMQTEQVLVSDLPAGYTPKKGDLVSTQVGKQYFSSQKWYAVTEDTPSKKDIHGEEGYAGKKVDADGSLPLSNPVVLKPEDIKAIKVTPERLKELQAAKAAETPEADVDAPEGTSASIFTVLPEDQRGESGDGYHQSGPWGKYGASGIMLQAEDTGKFFIVQRGGFVKSNKDKWQLAGGAMEENENPYQGAARELLEETSVEEGQLADFGHKGDVVFDNGQGWQYTNIAATTPTEFDIATDPKESNGGKWVTADELKEMRDNGELVPSFGQNVDNILAAYDKKEGDSDTVDIDETNANEIAEEPSDPDAYMKEKYEEHQAGDAPTGSPTYTPEQQKAFDDAKAKTQAQFPYYNPNSPDKPENEITVDDLKDLPEGSVVSQINVPFQHKVDYVKNADGKWAEPDGPYSLFPVSDDAVGGFGSKNHKLLLVSKGDGGTKEPDAPEASEAPEAAPRKSMGADDLDSLPAGSVAKFENADDSKVYLKNDDGTWSASWLDDGHPQKNVTSDQIHAVAAFLGEDVSVMKEDGKENPQAPEAPEESKAPDLPPSVEPLADWEKELLYGETYSEIVDAKQDSIIYVDGKSQYAKDGPNKWQKMGTMEMYTDEEVYNAVGTATGYELKQPNSSAPSAGSTPGKNPDLLDENNIDVDGELTNFLDKVSVGESLTFEDDDGSLNILEKTGDGEWEDADGESWSEVTINNIYSPKDLVGYKKNENQTEMTPENLTRLEETLGKFEIGDFFYNGEMNYSKDGDDEWSVYDPKKGIVLTKSTDQVLADIKDANISPEKNVKPSTSTEEPTSGDTNNLVMGPDLVSAVENAPIGSTITANEDPDKYADGVWTKVGDDLWESVYGTELDNLDLAYAYEPEHIKEYVPGTGKSEPTAAPEPQAPAAAPEAPEVTKVIDGINVDSDGTMWVPDKTGQKLTIGSVVTSKAGELGKIDYIQKGGTKVRVITQDGNTKFWNVHLVDKTPEGDFVPGENKYEIKTDEDGDKYLTTPKGERVYIGDTVKSPGKAGFEGQVVDFKSSGQFVMVLDPADGKIKPRKLDKIEVTQSSKQAPAPQAQAPEAPQATPEPPAAPSASKWDTLGDEASMIDMTQEEWDSIPVGSQIAFKAPNADSPSHVYTKLDSGEWQGESMKSGMITGPYSSDSVYTDVTSPTSLFKSYKPNEPKHVEAPSAPAAPEVTAKWVDSKHGDVIEEMTLDEFIASPPGSQVEFFGSDGTAKYTYTKDTDGTWAAVSNTSGYTFGPLDSKWLHDDALIAPNTYKVKKDSTSTPAAQAPPAPTPAQAPASPIPSAPKPYLGQSIDEISTLDGLEIGDAVYYNVGTSGANGDRYIKTGDDAWKAELYGHTVKTAAFESAIKSGDLTMGESVNNDNPAPNAPEPQAPDVPEPPAPAVDFVTNNNGDKISVGDIVSRPPKGGQGTVTAIDKNAGIVTFVDENGKSRKYKAKFIQLIQANSTTTGTNSGVKDPNSPWFEQPAPTPPADPATANVGKWLPDEFMQTLDDAYQAQKGKSITQSGYWVNIEPLFKDGNDQWPIGIPKKAGQPSSDMFDVFVSRGWLTPEQADEGRKLLATVKDPIKAQQAEHQVKVDKYHKDMADWKAANGILEDFSAGSHILNDRSDPNVRTWWNSDPNANPSAADATADAWAKKHLLPDMKKIQPSWKSRVQSYAGSWASAINGILRKNQVKKGSVTGIGPNEKKSLAEMDSAIASYTMPETIEVVRGTSLGTLLKSNGSYLQDFSDAQSMVGQVISDPGYMSTSVGHTPGIGGNAHLHIIIPKGANALYVNGSGGHKMTGYGSEREVIIPRGSKLYVHNVTQSQAYPGASSTSHVWLEMVPEGWTPEMGEENKKKFAGVTTQVVNKGDGTGGGVMAPPVADPAAPVV